MSLPGNGIFVVQGEMSILVTAMRRGTRWSSHSHQDEDHDVLLKAFHDLKTLLNRVEDLKLINPNIFLEPFLEIIRSEETTGPVTSLALASIHKFLNYGLIDPDHEGSALAVENIAGAVTRARFVGTDAAADALVLLRILHTLRVLLMSSIAYKLSDNAVCDIALSCFRICFESRLNELLRRTAEHVLKDMVQLLFTRLPDFTEDSRIPVNMKKIKMYPSSSNDQSRNKKKKSFRKSKGITEKDGVTSSKDGSNLSNSSISLQEEDNFSSPVPDTKHLHAHLESHLTTTPVTPSDNIVDMQGSISHTPVSSLRESELPLTDQNLDSNAVETNIQINITQTLQPNDENLQSLDNSSSDSNLQDSTADDQKSCQEYVNPRGVRFTPQSQDNVTLIPYGVICVRELFRFLISLCNPLDKQNTEVMIHLSLTLLTVAFEVGADHIGKYNSLLSLCKDELSRNLFSLLSTERISIFAADLQVCFLLFESLRTHLKFQLEFYLTKLIEIVVSDSVKVTYEHKEIALDNIVQLWRIPGLVTELYLNYDCDFYCTNLFEDLTKLLAKNAFPVTSGVYHTHLLSLDALLTIIESIRSNCNAKLEKKNDMEHTNDKGEITIENRDKIGFVSVAPSRQKLSTNIPTHEELKAIKAKKRWLPQGTEYFNTKPKKGIQFLQEHGILKPELDPMEVVHFLRENPGLDKKMIGEYISSRNNLQVLEVFVKSFDFTDLRIDEALRLYLETFRLPGEAPLISLLLEHFAEHWHKCNGEPFANADAAFTLAYAVIMLNVDQHNHNVKRQNTPMTCDEFKRNLKKVNGGSDFDQDMLDEIYQAIKSEEIVMPAEQTGIVRENYLWKVLLRRGASKDGVYIHVPNGTFDRELFDLIWGPTLAALSFVFDKSEDSLIYQRAIKGFQKCAFISSQFNISSNLDTLILSLCKFTQLNSSQQKPAANIAIQLASNEKAQLAFKTVLNLIHLHGSNLREGWTNILELVLALYNNKLLPNSFLEVDDFTEPSGKIQLICETVSSQKTETGLFSSLYSYMLSSEAVTARVPSAEEQELIEYANNFIKELNLEQIITESKFLQIESLTHLIRALTDFSKGPDGHKSLGTGYNQYITVFFLELLLKIVIQNRDRVFSIWQTVQDHIYSLVMGAATCDYQYLLERSIIGLLRLAIRLMRNEEMSPVILQSLKMLLLLKPITLHKISRPIAYGLFELLKTSAQNIHTDSDWKIIFTLLECIGAGAHAPKPAQITGTSTDQGTKSDGEAPVSSEEESNITTERGYTSDSELTKTSPGKNKSMDSSTNIPMLTRAVSQQTNGWILVGTENESNILKSPANNQCSIVLERRLGPHNPVALLKCCESLAFLVRDVAHITPYNFEDCVRCIRTFVEASLNGDRRNRRHTDPITRNRSSTWRYEEHRRTSSPSGDDDSDSEDVPSGYHQVSIQLLDLMHTLHTRTAQIFRWWAEEHGDIAISSLWPRGWCPLLQGIARLCCDSRKQVRMSAITYLQRALLMPDLQTLSGPEWEACFHRVLFPLLNQLLETPQDPVAMEGLEEARMRAATVLSKVFLHHLTPLLTLSTFTVLWLTILDFMDKYMHAGNSDLLYEAIPESLKNMLLVMDSAKVFNDGDDYSQLWNATWERINSFLPNLKDELFKNTTINETLLLSDQNQLTNESIQKSSTPSTPESTTPRDVVVTQNDVVNATRNSIILQPTIVDNIASPLFAHLGQMVSTPIGVPSNIGQNQIVPPYSNLPSEQTADNKMNTGYYQSHNHPPCTLYSTPHTGLPIPVCTQQNLDPNSPQPLYTEYINNPYNVTDKTQYPYYYQLENSTFMPQLNLINSPLPPPLDSNRNSVEDEQQKLEDTESHSTNYTNTNSESISQVPQNIFQSSNYFYTDTKIPPGSEILFGTNTTANVAERRDSTSSKVVFYNPSTMPGANIPLVPPSDLK